MIRSRRAVQVLLLTGIIASGAFAAPLAYTIRSDHQQKQALFSYDSALADGTQFSSFLVDWDGNTIDFLTLANSGGINNGCDPGASNFVHFQAQDVGAEPTFLLDDKGDPGHETLLQLQNLTGGFRSMSADGSWSVTRNDAPPTPEPSWFILALAGVVLPV